MRKLAIPLIAVLTAQTSGAAAQDGLRPDGGRLLMTSGVSSIEGQAGGGLVPWGVIAGYGTRGSWGANAFETRTITGEYVLRSRGAALGLRDRLEVSFAHHAFDTQDRGAEVGFGEGFTFEQAVYGAKLRLFGHLIADQGTPLPQVTLSVLHKRNEQGDILKRVGAGDDEGTEAALSATKLFLGSNLIVTGGLRYTNANQFGLMGFGGDGQDGHTFQGEASVAYMLARDFVVGAEYRSKPDNLARVREEDAFDVFAAYFPSKHLSVTAAYVDLGSIANTDGEEGAYLSLQTGF